MQLEKYRDKLDEVLKYWESIEESIKSAEFLQGRVTIPAINELRYAGRQIVRAVSLHGDSNFDVEFDRALTVAKQYLTNADHDVVDAVIAFIGRRINELNHKYGKAAISDRVEDYAKLCELIERSMLLIREARRNPLLRDKNYDIIKNELLEPILAHNKSLVQSDTAIALELAAYENAILEVRRKNRQAYIVISALIFVLLIEILSRLFL